MAQDKGSKWTHITGTDDHPAVRKSGVEKDICRKCGQLLVLRAELDAKVAKETDVTAAEATRKLAVVEAEAPASVAETAVATEQAGAGHKVRWFATVGEGKKAKREARTGKERGQVRWDAECSCGWASGEPQVFMKVRKAVNAHKEA